MPACPLAGTHRPIPATRKSPGRPRDCHGTGARKERAPGIPRGMMRGKCAHWLAMTRLFWICLLRRGRADGASAPTRGAMQNREAGR